MVVTAVTYNFFPFEQKKHTLFQKQNLIKI